MQETRTGIQQRGLGYVDPKYRGSDNPKAAKPQLTGKWIAGPFEYKTTRRWRRIHKRALQALGEYLRGNKEVLGGALKP